MQIELYNTMVLPVIMHALEIWGFDIIRDMEMLQVKYLKHLLYAHKKTSTYVIYDELFIYRLQVTSKCKMINFWLKLISVKESK